MNYRGMVTTRRSHALGSFAETTPFVANVRFFLIDGPRFAQPTWRIQPRELAVRIYSL